MKFKIIHILFTSCILGLCTISCKKKDGISPNILLVISEDHGQELSCYGDTVIATPNIDKIAKQGIRFKNAYVTQTCCSPSRSSIYTGLYPHQNGHLGLATHGYHYIDGIQNIYSVLKREGYSTGMIGKLHLNPENMFPIDYRRIEDSNFSKHDLNRYALFADSFFIEKSQPFLLTVSLPDAHWPFQDQVENKPSNPFSAESVVPLPYIGIDNERVRKQVTGYYNCLLRLDEAIGQIMQALDKSEKTKNTLVFFLSDHGAEMARGKFTLYEPGSKIPFIMKWPGKIKEGIVSEQLVSTIDIVPTILDVVGIHTENELPGKSITSLFLNPNKPFRKYLFTEKNCDAVGKYFPQRAVRNQKFKLIYSCLDNRVNPVAEEYMENRSGPYNGSVNYNELVEVSPEFRDAYKTWLNPPKIRLYDLENDPLELVNLSQNPSYESIKIKLYNELLRWMRNTNDPFLNADKLGVITKEHDSTKKSRNMKWEFYKYVYN